MRDFDSKRHVLLQCKEMVSFHESNNSKQQKYNGTINREEKTNGADMWPKAVEMSDTEQGMKGMDVVCRLVCMLQLVCMLVYTVHMTLYEMQIIVESIHW